jgi:tetratricopeptide (TPR) repeat protein
VVPPGSAFDPPGEDAVSVPLPPATDAARTAASEARERAISFGRRGEFQAALLHFDEALRHARATGDAAFVDWIFVSRAAAAVEVEVSEPDLLELKEILLRRTDPSIALRAASSLSVAFDLRRDTRKALFYARIAERHAVELGEPALLSAAANRLGAILAASSRFEEAVTAFRSALEWNAKEGGDSEVWRAQAEDNLGYCLIALDRLDEGMELVHGALETLRKQNASGFLVYPLMDLSFGYLKQDRFAEARFFGEAALERLETGGPTADTAVEKNLLYLLGEACHLAGDEDEAEEWFARLSRHYPEFKNLRTYLEVFDLRNVINLRT